MLNRGSYLSLAVLDLALGFVKHTAFIQLGVSATARCDLPYHLTIFMLFTLLDTGVFCIRLHRVFFAKQQLGNLRDTGHIGGSTVDMMNHAGLDISASDRPFLCKYPLMTARIAGAS